MKWEEVSVLRSGRPVVIFSQGLISTLERCVLPPALRVALQFCWRKKELGSFLVCPAVDYSVKTWTTMLGGTAPSFVFHNDWTLLS